MHVSLRTTKNHNRKNSRRITMFKYFNNLETIEEIRKVYNKLAFQYHPDLNKSEEACRIMQEINAEYQLAIKAVKSGESLKDNFDAEKAAQYPDIIKNIINLQGIKIEICGSWVWLTGKTYLYCEELKSLNFHFSRSKKAWYWNSSKKAVNRLRGMYSLKEIYEKFGKIPVETEEQAQIQYMR